MAATTDPASSATETARLEALSPRWRLAARGAGVALGLFALWTAGPGLPEDHLHLGVYTLLTWMLVLVLYPALKSTAWRAPTAAEWIIGAVLVASLSASILGADRVAVSGAAPADWVGWIVGAVAAAATVRRPKTWDLALLGASVLCLLYFMTFYLELVDRAGAWTETDFWIAALATLVSLEVARRGLGPAIPVIAIGALLYAYFGPIFPDQIAHAGSSIRQIANYLLYSQEGLFGVMTSVMANYVLIFIFLGAFMVKSGMGRFFIDMPLSLAGRSAGGPAKVAVIASAIFGSISGSSLANIVSTGSFTIPLMKRVGFRPHVAGAVENTASLGGQLLPPVMGAGAFVMAEITSVPYLRIIAISAAPALLYLLSIGLIVHFEAKKSGIEGIAESDWRRPSEVFREGWFHLLPFVVLLGFLVLRFSPDWCAVMAIGAIILINWARVALARVAPDRFDRPVETLGLRGIGDALVQGAQNSLIVGAIAAAVGIIVGMVALTGFGLKMSYLLVSASEGHLFFALVLVALASLLLGMALPITAAYLVLVILAGPALENLGLALITAHMIVFWLSQDSNITPPVCLGAYVAASIAGGDPWKTGWASFRFGKMLYVIPLLFAYTPILLSGGVVDTLWVLCSALVGTAAFAAWTAGYLVRRTKGPAWIALGLAALLCFWPAKISLVEAVPGEMFNLLGVVLFFALYAWQRSGRVWSATATSEKK